MCVLAMLTLAATPCNAAGLDFSRGASVRQNVLAMSWPESMRQLAGGERGFGMSETRMRVLGDAEWGDLLLHAALENRTFFTSTDTARFTGGGGGSLFGAGGVPERWDLTAEHIGGDDIAMSTRLDRMQLSWRIGDIDIIAGRQPVTLGTSHFVGVLDVVAPFAPGALDATYKPGVDAVRVRRLVGMTGEAEIIAVGGTEWEDGAVLGRFRAPVKGVDIEIVGGRFRRRGFGGFGWEGGVGEFGVWGEVALYGRRDGEPVRNGNGNVAFSGVTGTDYSLADDTIIGGAVFYQDFGATDPADLAAVYTDTPFREGWAFFGGAAYGVATLHRQLHPLVSGDLVGIVSIIDGSSLWQPVITMSTGDNSDLVFYGWIGEGRGTARLGRMRSEFGAMPDGAGVFARWFF